MQANRAGRMNWDAPTPSRFWESSRELLVEIRKADGKIPTPPAAEIETLSRLMFLGSFSRLDEQHLLEANMLRAELALHYPFLAARFSIGPKSISFDSSP